MSYPFDTGDISFKDSKVTNTRRFGQSAVGKTLEEVTTEALQRDMKVRAIEIDGEVANLFHGKHQYGFNTRINVKVANGIITEFTRVG